MLTEPATISSVRRVLALVALSASLAIHPGTALANHAGNHCITPAGDDLNEVFGTPDAFVAPFCTDVRVGDRWRAILRIEVAGADYVLPQGYSPSRPTLDADFLTKFVSARYVVDPGTRRERTYSFKAKQLVVQRGVLPQGTRFVRWVTPSLHPLPPGNHSVEEYATLTTDFWDGLGVDPAVNSIPAGESLAGVVQFRVVKPH